MITQGNILLAQGTSAQIETSARPNMFVHNSTDKSLVYSPDGIAKYRYDDRSSIDGRFANIHTHANKSNLDVINQSLSTTASPSFAGVSTSAVALYPNAAQLYNGADIPQNFIGQTMATNDGWKIYGEGTENSGRLVLEVNDDGDELIVIKTRKTYAPYTTNVYQIWHEGNFNPSNKSDVGHTHSLLNITDRAAQYVDDNYDVGTAKYLRWNNYGDNHEIIDASNGTAPNGATISKVDSDSIWTPDKPTLVGWNGTSTYGVRVDSSRLSDDSNKLGGQLPSYYATSGHTHTTFPNLIISDSGTGKNLRIGNDSWIGDCDWPNVLQIMGVSDESKGYVRFGNDSNGLGYNGSYLTYTGPIAFGPTGTKSPNAYSKYVFNVGNGDYNGIDVFAESSNKSAFISIGTQSNSNSTWGVQKRDDGAYGTTSGCFSIEDGSASFDQRRFPIIIDSGDDGQIRLSRSLGLTNGRNISLTKDITPTTATNTNYSSAPIVINRATQDSSTSTAAGIGFHNQGVNASTLYYDPATSVFKYNRHDSGPLVTIWDDSNLTPGNYLKKSDTFGGSDGYEFSVESGTNSGGLCLKLTDDNNGSEYFVVRNSDGNPSLIAKSDRGINVGYQNYTSFKPTLEIGDDQYGLSVDAGYLNMFSNSGDVRVYSKVGAGDAVLKGMVWHSGNLPVTAAHLSGTTSNLQTQINNIISGATVNVISVASNTQLNATGRHLSATIPANTISQTVPTQVKVVGNIGANYVGGTATIEIEIGGNNVFTHTITATGQNEDDIFEIDFGIRYAGSSTMECYGLCKIDNIVTTTQTPKMRYISAFFTGVPTNSYVFDVKSTITGTAGASVTLTKVTKG